MLLGGLTLCFFLVNSLLQLLNISLAGKVCFTDVSIDEFFLYLFSNAQEYMGNISFYEKFIRCLSFLFFGGYAGKLVELPNPRLKLCCCYASC